MTAAPASYSVDIFRCADGSYYTGMSSNLELRIQEHHQGVDPRAYTFGRRPITLVWSQSFSTHDEAFHAERQIKGWSRAKKEALIRGDLEEVHRIVRKEWERELETKGSGGDVI